MAKLPVVKFDKTLATLKGDDRMIVPADSTKGGEGSGNFNHAGRPGEVGGSGEGGGVAAVEKAPGFAAGSHGYINVPMEFDKTSKDAVAAKGYGTKGPWRDAKTEDVPIKKVVALQPIVDREEVKRMVSGDIDASASDDPVIAVKVKDKYYLFDGHHRVTAAFYKGEKTIKMDVIEKKTEASSTKGGEGSGNFGH